MICEEIEQTSTTIAGIGENSNKNLKGEVALSKQRNQWLSQQDTFIRFMKNRSRDNDVRIEITYLLIFACIQSSLQEE
jgi:hypothetical protein